MSSVLFCFVFFLLVGSGESWCNPGSRDRVDGRKKSGGKSRKSKQNINYRSHKLTGITVLNSSNVDKIEKSSRS